MVTGDCAVAPLARTFDDDDHRPERAEADKEIRVELALQRRVAGQWTEGPDERFRGPFR